MDSGCVVVKVNITDDLLETQRRHLAVANNTLVYAISGVQAPK